MVKHHAGVERMARAIKQSVDGSSYPSSSSAFPITSAGQTDGQSGRRWTDPSGRFTFLAPSSRRRYMNALQPEKEKGEDQQDGITIHREHL